MPHCEHYPALTISSLITAPAFCCTCMGTASVNLTRQPIIHSAAVVNYYYRVAFVLAFMTVH